MRLYGKKFAKRFVDERAQGRTETRDAVLWDIDEGNFRCRVKIQGSGEFIVAHYPRNWKRHPYWLKPGNAVRILHRSGVRGYVEVIGEGRAIPLPVEGSALPPEPSLPDMILSGLELLPTSPESWAVIITNGTYRIGGVVYTYTGELLGSEIIMDDPAPMTLGDAIVMMGTVQYTATLDPAPAVGYYRYDAFVIGVDGTIDYLVGTASKTYPVKPTIPSDHLLIGDYIFVKGGATVIYAGDIGAEWAPQVPTTLAMTYSETFAWNPIDNEPEMNVTATVKDQYGVTLPTSSNGYTISLEKLAGIGQVWSTQSGYDNDEVQNTCTSGYTFKYVRDQLGTETNPVVLEAVLLNRTDCMGWAMITLLDISGEVI